VARRRHWFELWITESCSVRLISRLSGYSTFKLNTINSYWLNRVPKESNDYSRIQNVIYDATYFHKDGCLLNLMDATNQRIIAHRYVDRESFKEAFTWFAGLKDEGLDPEFMTVDGERSVTRAIKMVWPMAKIQRCLYHIQHEGMRWLRTHPKTQAGRELRVVLSRLSTIKTPEERDEFVEAYRSWVDKHEDSVRLLPRTVIAFKDLRRAIVLINNALPDMFHYIENKCVHPTTNALEGFHSRLKADYRRHRGLTKKHRIQYIDWYCYFKNRSITNTF
jgi:hypothetical protein